MFSTEMQAGSPVCRHTTKLSGLGHGPLSIENGESAARGRGPLQRRVRRLLLRVRRRELGKDGAHPRSQNGPFWLLQPFRRALGILTRRLSTRAASRRTALALVAAPAGAASRNAATAVRSVASASANLVRCDRPVNCPRH